MSSSAATIQDRPSHEGEDESMPLLHHQQRPRKKPFYRARPLWLVPFAIFASLVRGMTLAPRVEVFTQLSCNRLHGAHKWDHSQVTSSIPAQQLHASLYASIDPLGPHFFPSPFVLSPPMLQRINDSVSTRTRPGLAIMSSSVPNDDTDERDSENTEDPRRLPSARCLADPAVQAAAARLQTIMTTTMGLLSALTTGWWGHFGERHGRTKVLAIATFGLFLTDLTFILVSTPGSALAEHGHKLLVLAPFIEGLLGGWSTLQSASSAYLSDCTSPGSRAHIFSRFQGVFYLGFAVGPSIGGWLIQHPFGVGRIPPGEKVVTSVFWVAVACSFVNFIMMLFVFPESLDKKKQERALRAAAKGKGKTRAVDGLVRPAHQQEETQSTEDDEEDASGQDSAVESRQGVVARFLSPLAIFLPVVVLDPSPNGLGLRKRRDWSLTMLAVALFGFMLSTGMYQIKYLYAAHTYGWGAEQLSYYISFMGGGRALWLLVLLPTLIEFLKPKPRSAASDARANGIQITTPGQDPAGKTLVKGKKPKPTRAQLGREIGFDLILTRCSLLVDVVSHSLIAALPAPTYKANVMNTLGKGPGGGVGNGDLSFQRSQALFVLASSLNGMGSGSVPAIHSLALCMLQVRALNARPLDGGHVEDEAKAEEEGTGALFGALAVLQAVGQMILGPMLFGLVYSGTVATFPKAIFVLASGLMVFALAMMLCVRNPVRVHPLAGKRRRRDVGEVERGRSRVSKDLRGGAIGYYGYGSTTDSSSAR